jgi:hypothetical protein
MCKEVPVIPVVDGQEQLEKMEGQGAGEAKWVADPKNNRFPISVIIAQYFFLFRRSS